MRVVIALGGNAIARRGESLDAAAQRRRVRDAAVALAGIARDWETVVTHGNGPQVGLLALQAQSTPNVAPFPLDVLGAETEGMIGYWIEQELARLLPHREVATLLTQVEVDPQDPAFASPTKPIGPLYAESDARDLAQRFGWRIAPEAGGFRRVVASPAPLRILELHTIELLVGSDVIVVCAGGGGIPVVGGPDGALRGVEAVIDKDRTAALLAALLHADALLLLTDVDAVYEDWPERQRPIRNTTPDALRKLDLHPGSMGPKALAACLFAEQTGRPAVIGALEQARLLLDGEAGTRVTPGG
jgi:carbamate kinase